MCSVSCGEGLHHRRVMCWHTRGSGEVQLVAPQACAPRDRPPDKKACAGPPCDQWNVEPVDQVRLAKPLSGLPVRVLLLDSALESQSGSEPLSRMGTVL